MRCRGSCKNTYWHGGLIHASYLNRYILRWRSNVGRVRQDRMSEGSELPVKPGPHQQQCRSNIVECYNVECCFDTVAGVDGALECVKIPSAGPILYSRRYFSTCPSSLPFSPERLRFLSTPLHENWTFACRHTLA